MKILYGINKVSLDNQNSLGLDTCVALEINVEIEAYGNKVVSLCLGEEETLMDAKNISYKYTNISNCNEELREVKQYWFELLSRVQVKTPIESMNIMLNDWLIYQTLTARMWGKTGYYQSGGATRI